MLPTTTPAAGGHTGHMGICASGAPGDRGRLVPLSDEEALDLLGGTSVGRIVFTQDALPAIQPVLHSVVDGEVVATTLVPDGGLPPVAGQVVAYEADEIDADGLVWNVVVIGVAAQADKEIRISPDIVHGHRIGG